MNTGWQHWGVAEWVTLISAVTAGVVSISNAIRGHQIEQKIDAHERRAEARARQK